MENDENQFPLRLKILSFLFFNEFSLYFCGMVLNKVLGKSGYGGSHLKKISQPHSQSTSAIFNIQRHR